MPSPLQFTGIQSSGSVASQGKAFASNVTVGNLIVVAVSLYRSPAGAPSVSSIADTLGNTYILVPGSRRTSTADTNACTEIWSAKNIAGGANTVTVTPTGNSFTSFAILEVPDMDQTGPEDGQQDAEGNSTTPATGSLTNTDELGLSVAGLTHTGSDTGITEDSGNGWTLTFEAESTTNCPIAVEHKLTAIGATNPGWTLGAARAWIATGSGFKLRRYAASYGEFPKQKIAESVL